MFMLAGVFVRSILICAPCMSVCGVYFCGLCSVCSCCSALRSVEGIVGGRAGGGRGVRRGRCGRSCFGGLWSGRGGRSVYSFMDNVTCLLRPLVVVSVLC